MINIRYVQQTDKEFWFSIDRFLPEREFENKVKTKSGYVLEVNEIPVGLMRYNLFWDHIPFCNLIFIDYDHHRKGYGKKMMEHWEADMKAQGYGRLLTSMQADENAQHFYRKLGYHDCGGFVLAVPEPMELIMTKVM